MAEGRAFVPGIKPIRGDADALGDRSPRGSPRMTNDAADLPPMRMGDCPYCERAVLVYEEPPRCPICACPLESSAMRPFDVPGRSEP